MKETELLTLSEAESVLPFIAGKTIKKWIAAGIFRPRVLGGLGPGRGHQLDRWDLLTAAVMHNLLASGVRFKEFQWRGLKFSEAKVLFLKEGEFRVLGGERPMQEYLAEHEGDVIVAADFMVTGNCPPFEALQGLITKMMIFQTGRTLSRATLATIRFAPRAWARNHLLPDYGLPWPGRETFINCGSWTLFIGNIIKRNLE